MITSEYKYFSPKRHNVEGTIQKILSFLKREDMWVSVLFTNDQTIKDLNKQYRGKNKATDVLSFSQTEGDSFDFPSFDDVVPLGVSSHLLGDIVISVDTAKMNAQEYKNTLTQEIEALLIHGILHLIGYDHERSEKDYAAMKSMELKIKKYLYKDTVVGSVLLNRN